MFQQFGFYVGCLFMFYSEFFVWSRFFNKKINYKNPLLYVFIVFLAFVGMINYLYVNAFIKMIIITILMCVCNWVIFKKQLNEVVISTIYGQLLATISDGIGVILLVLLVGKDVDFVKNNFFDSLIGNVVVALIYIAISYIPFIKNIYSKLVKFTDRFKNINLLMWCLLVIFSINFLIAIVYYDMNSIFVIVINCLLIVIYSFIVYKTISQHNISLMIEAENESLMKSLDDYESMVDRQRIDNHENKNQLLIIKNMIKKKDKDVIKYIDTIVKDEKEDDEALYTRVKNIPSGGLQGIIYQKMLAMKDKHLLFSLDVSRDVRKIDLDNMGVQNNYKLCKIIGVLLDNAIEESLKIDNNCIMISLYVDDDMLIIDISNRFNGKVDLSKIDDRGYTTKGNGHGYGLSLVKEIISSSDIFTNERKINKDIFKQVIKVRIK